MIRKDMDALAREMADARRVLREAEQPDRTGIGTLITEAALVFAAGVLWWLVRDTAFLKSAWFPWVAVAFPVIALGVPLVLAIRKRRRRANQQIHPIAASAAQGERQRWVTEMRTIWVEILVISAIILIPVSFALRVIYGKRWLEWENNLVESWGINAVAYTMAKIAILVCLTGWWVWRERRKRQKQNALTYDLPKT